MHSDCDLTPRRKRLPPVRPAIPFLINPASRAPITHCIYLIKENRTYDQVFARREGGQCSDAKLCLFPERVTPNQHEAIAHDFVLAG